MKKEKMVNKYAKYNEDLIPTKAKVVRRSGNFMFIFEVNGYRGKNTGELYYSRDEALRMEEVISVNISNRGIELFFAIPQILLKDKAASSSTISHNLVLSAATL